MRRIGLAILIGTAALCSAESAVPHPSVATIRVLTADLVPVAGARVVLTRPEPWQGVRDVHEATSDGKGIAVVHLKDGRGVFDINVCLSQFHPVCLPRVPASGSYVVVMNLDRTNPDERMINTADAPNPVFDPCQFAHQPAKPQ